MAQLTSPTLRKRPRRETCGPHVELDLHVGWRILASHPGALKQVSAGSDRAVGGVNRGNEIFRWTGETWERIAGDLSLVAVADWDSSGALPKRSAVQETALITGPTSKVVA